jgi:hypothetical protein
MLLLILVLFITGTLVVAWTVAGKRLEEEPEQPQQMEAGTLLSILVPKMNDKTSLSAEMMFMSLHGLLSKTPGLQEHLSFELVATHEGIRFFVYLPTYFRTFVEGQIYAQYPNANISEVEQDYIHQLPSGHTVVTAAEMTLSKEYYHPIKTFVDFQVDPLAAITGSVERLNHDEQVWMQLIIRPLDDIWQEAGYKYVNKTRKGESVTDEGQSNFIVQIFNDVVKEFVNLPTFMLKSMLPGGNEPEAKKDKPTVELTAGQDLELKAIESKMNKPGFETALRIVSIGQSEQSSQQALHSIIASFKQFSMTHLNSFQISPVERKAEDIFHDYQLRAFPNDDESYFVLNAEELASVYHLPNLTVETPTIAWSKAKQLEPPLNLPVDVPTVFAQTAFRSRQVQFGIEKNDRRRHMYMIGKTGTGKSTLLENMILKDILAGEGLAVMDPHGDTIDRLLDNIPENRIDDVVLFDPSDVSHPVSLNMLELFDPTQGNLTASALVDVFKRTFDSWGPRLEYLLRNCLLTLVEVPNATLLGVNRLLIDKDYRKYIVSSIEDESLRAFWNKEYAAMAANDRLITEAVAPIQNKVGQFLQTSTIRNIVGQAKSTVKINEIMDEGKILLINLSKGKIGEDNSSLLGAMIISRLKNAAMTRVRMPEEQRKDFYVYADEFQNFASSSFATILSEARKYRLNLIITHQYIDQLPEEVRMAVFGNVGTTISFTVGPNDASVLSTQFAPSLTAEDMVALEKHHIYLKLMIDGMESRPFSASTLPPIARHEGHRAAIIEASRRKYAPRTVVDVEKRINDWNLKKFQVGVDDVALRELKRRQQTAREESANTIVNQAGEPISSQAVMPATHLLLPKSDHQSPAATIEVKDISPKAEAPNHTYHQPDSSVRESTPQPSADHTNQTDHIIKAPQPSITAPSFNHEADDEVNIPQVEPMPLTVEEPPSAHPIVPRHRISQRPATNPITIHGVPGGIGHTTTINHITTSNSSGEIILNSQPPVAKGG